MDLVTSDILEVAQGLSTVLQVGFLLLGGWLWLFGGRTHRFWLVMVTTLLTGIWGLYSGPEYGMQPLVAGLLLAIAAGALALSLMRVLFFIGAGFLALWLARSIAPGWNEPLACFLAGGLLGAFLFHVWVTALASLLGTLFLMYSSLCLVARFARVDVVSWASHNGPLLNWACAVLTVLGILVQYLMQNRKAGAGKEKAVKPEKPAKEKEAKKPKPAPEPPPEEDLRPQPRWWAGWFGGKKAG
jgi:hypothetical protein